MASPMDKEVRTRQKEMQKHPTALGALKHSTAKHKGFDGNKRWRNSATEGHGVNSPAMMEARAKHSALKKKTEKKGRSMSEAMSSGLKGKSHFS